MDEPTIDWRARAEAAGAHVAALEQQVADLAALAGRDRLARDETRRPGCSGAGWASRGARQGDRI
jgi:hypothetical protein